MVERGELLSYLAELLRIDAFSDYAPNGLQVEGRQPVHRLVTGVTASQALLEEAIAFGADTVLVHHGYFWKGEPPVIVGMKRQRLKLLLDHEINLLAYHLPLDGHEVLGNNAQLAGRLGIRGVERLGEGSEHGLVFGGVFDPPIGALALAQRIEEALGRVPLHISGSERPIAKVAWCTGAAQGMIELAAGAGMDAYISGEISEPTVHAARELGIHYFAAGHHATERGGVEALGEHLADRFELIHRFVDIENPV